MKVTTSTQTQNFTSHVTMIQSRIPTNLHGKVVSNPTAVNSPYAYGSYSYNHRVYSFKPSFFKEYTALYYNHCTNRDKDTEAGPLQFFFQFFSETSLKFRAPSKSSFMCQQLSSVCQFDTASITLSFSQET